MINLMQGDCLEVMKEITWARSKYRDYYPIIRDLY
jgi:hypothetical protein